MFGRPAGSARNACRLTSRLPTLPRRFPHVPLRSLSVSAVSAIASTPPRSLPSGPMASVSQRPLVVLGLESSADDACAAVVTSDRRVLSSVVMKQHKENARWGGIHPLEAMRRHLTDMPVAIARALEDAGVSLADLDAVAYTRGPGMAGCLSVCTASARALAAGAGLPLVGIHHMQAHALTPLLTEEAPPAFPFLTLLVSGGHTLLVLAKGEGEFGILMESVDIAIGDAFDKVARVLQLPHSAEHGLGPVLEEYAAAAPLPPYDTAPLPPLPLALGPGTKAANTLGFSFAGLCSAAERAVWRALGWGESAIAAAIKDAKGSRKSGDRHTVPLALQRAGARAFQTAAVAHVVAKIRQCVAAQGLDVRGLVVSGGVGSNQYLRQELAKMLDDYPGTTLHYPPISLCTDNAAMIAWTAILRMRQGLKGEPCALPLRPKWSLEELYDDVPPECYEQAERSAQRADGE